MNELFLYLPQFFSGLYVTIILTVSALVIGLVLASTFAIIKYSDQKYLKAPVNILIFFIRGTPLLIQIFLIYYGLGQFAFIRNSSLWFLLKEPMTCSIIALAINSACYTSIILSGAIASVPRNEIAACYSLGMSKWLAFRRIIFPIAFRKALPAYSNEVIMIIKGTSLASTITLMDLMGVTQQVISNTYNTIFYYCVAACFYLFLNAIVTFIFHQMMHHTALKYE